MKITGIYIIESKIKSNRIYIGSSVNISERWYKHIKELKLNKHVNGKLQRHFNKYGESDLHFYIIKECNKENLLQEEQYFIDSYKPYFNICKKAGSRLGCKHKMSEQGKINLSIAHLGKPSHRKGSHHSEEAKQKNREKHLGKISGMKGKKHTKESNEKNRLSNLGRPAWNKGIPSTNKRDERGRFIKKAA